MKGKGAKKRKNERKKKYGKNKTRSSNRTPNENKTHRHQSCASDNSTDLQKDKIKTMAEFEKEFSDLFTVNKDPSKAFNLNVAKCLKVFVDNFINGDGPPNFSAAAMVLQAASSSYGRKVEYLHTLCTTLHEKLMNKQKDGDPNKANRKEKTARKVKLYDPFCSTEIKPGKNLSCLRKKNTVKKPNASKKSPKSAPYKVYSFVPVDLLPLESEEKGDVFFDTNGEPVANKSDYTLNKCRVINSGWLLLPTVSAELILDVANTTDYIPPELEDSDGDVADTPNDEGYPASSGCPSSPPTAPSSQVPGSQESDEGLGSLQSTPCEVGSSLPVKEVEGVGSGTPLEGLMEVERDDPANEGNENIPLDPIPAASDEDLSARPVRRSMRRALQMTQLNAKNDKTTREEIIALKKAIQKKNTCNIPSKLRNANKEIEEIKPASIFCSKTFFSSDFPKSDLHTLDVTAFSNNSKFNEQINQYKKAITAAKSKKQENGDTAPDEEDENASGVEELKEADADGEPANPGLEYDDFEIHNSPTRSVREENPTADENSVGDNPATDAEIPLPTEIEDEPVIDMDAEFRRLADEQTSRFRGELRDYEHTSELNERVRAWQKKVAPFLKEIKKREKFDIDKYGARILANFKDDGSKQAITFKDFCKDMEKWEVHRYFMALLPLANVENVALQNATEEGVEEIWITLKKATMHHKELEKFGHNAGEHS